MSELPVGFAWRRDTFHSAQQTEQTASLRLINRFRLDQTLTPLYKHGAYRNDLFIYIYFYNICTQAILYLFIAFEMLTLRVYCREMRGLIIVPVGVCPCERWTSFNYSAFKKHSCIFTKDFIVLKIPTICCYCFQITTEYRQV